MIKLEKEMGEIWESLSLFVCERFVFVCLCERETNRERDKQREREREDKRAR